MICPKYPNQVRNKSFEKFYFTTNFYYIFILKANLLTKLHIPLFEPNVVIEIVKKSVYCTNQTQTTPEH